MARQRTLDRTVGGGRPATACGLASGPARANAQSRPSRRSRPTSPLKLVSRAVLSFHPSSVSLLSRRNFRRELVYAFLFSPTQAVIEGGIIGVIAKITYSGVVDDRLLNLMVGLLTATPEFANITSFLWTAVTHGRAKIRMINVLQAATLVLVGLIALTPVTPGGLFLMAGLFAAARICFTGVVTLRATVWRHNYTRHDRARATGKFATIAALIIAATGYLVGTAMDASPENFRVAVPLACILGAVGVFVYGRIRLRGHRHLLKAERSGPRHERPSVNPASMWRLLRQDRHYASFQLSMSLLGAGNLMLTAPLAIVLKDRFGQGYVGGIWVLNTIPLIMLPLIVPLWARLLARTHVVRFRSIHSWVFVVGQTLVLLAVLTTSMPLLMVAMAIQGAGYAGGSLAWNLGHLDFAPRHKATQYMAVHVTLNGVRGILAPMLGVQLYIWLELVRPGSGAWVFAISALLCAAGGMGFILLKRSMGELARSVPRE